MTPEMPRSAERMAALVQIQRMLVSSEATPEELMDRIPDLALGVVEASGSVFELLDGDGVVLRSGSAAAVAAQALGLRLPLEGSLSGEAIRLDRTVRTDDTENDSRVAAEACRTYGLRSVLVTVVRDKAGPIGVLKLYDFEPHRFGPAEANILELLAEALGAVIQRKRAEGEVQQALRVQAGIVRMQQQVTASSAGLQESLDLIVESARELIGAEGASIALVDGDDMVCHAVCGLASARLGHRLPNKGSLAGLSIARGELLFCDDAEVDPRVNRVACRELGVRSLLVAPVRAGDSVAGALRVFSTRPHAFAQIDVGTIRIVAEWLGVVLERAAAAERLHDSESQYRMLFAGHALPMWVYDIETLRFVAVNDSAIRHYGYTKEEFLSMTIRDLRTPQARALLDDYLAHRGDVATSVRLCEHRRKDGSIIDVESSDSTIAFADRPARLVLAQDITERRKAELRTQKSEWLLNIAGRAAHVGGWSMDLRKDVFSWSDELSALHDLPPGTAPSVERALSYYAPESRAAMNRAVSRMSREGIPYDLELDIVTAGGRRIAVRSIGEAVRDAAGEIIGTQGAVQDITDRKRAQEEVHALAASLTTTLGSITDGFYTLDRDWRFTYVNHETERLLGSSGVELIGRVIWEALPGAVGSEFDRQFRAAVERRSAVTFESYYEPWKKWFEVHAYPSTAGLTVSFRDMTDRHHEQEKLRLLQTCVACMKDVVIITEARADSGAGPRIVFVNDAFVRQTGYSRDEVLGLTPRLLQGPKTQRRELDRIGAALQAREPVRAELINYTKAGAEYWVELEIVPVWSAAGTATHFVAVERDATERRRAQEALRSLNESLEAKVAERTLELELTNSALVSKEEEIRSVVENMADGVITFSDDGIVRSANSKVETIFGHAPEALVGQSISVLIPALDMLAQSIGDGPRLAIGSAITVVGGENSGRHRGGDLIALDVAISHYRIHGKRLWTAILRDIGERVRIVADLEQARLGAEEASRAKSAFVAAMSHEIRTPMNGVIGMIEVLNQTPLAPDQARMLGLARDSAHALLGIIEDILDFSKIEAGRVELERTPLALADVVERSGALVRGMASGKGVRLTIDADPALPEAVWGDGGRLRQVIVNLLSNAIKFSAGRPDPRVSLRASLSERSADRVTVQIEVEDNGIGMDSATLERLFQPFAQADVSTTRRFGGTGLGLAISTHLIGLMGGYIDVQSTPGRGSTFLLRVPFFVAPAEWLAGEPGSGTAPPLEARPAVRALVAAHVQKVLVAEDNDINQQVIIEQLTRLGYRAAVVANGREALALWRGGGFGALLTDLQMPDIDGYELTALIRSEEKGGPRIPIIALTANALKGEASRCMAAGMDDYLTKPVQMAMLGATLERWLSRDAGEAAPCVAAPVPAEGLTAPSRGPEPVDETVLPALIGDDAAVLREFMLDFVSSATEAAAEMAQAFAADDSARAGAVAHRLKSSARAVGALRLGDICESIERPGQLCPDEEAPAATMPAFEAELERVRHWIDIHAREPLPAPHGTRAS